MGGLRVRCHQQFQTDVYARGWLVSSNLRTFAGQLDVAIEHGEASLRLSPRARIGTPLNVIGFAHFLSGRAAWRARLEQTEPEPAARVPAIAMPREMSRGPCHALTLPPNLLNGRPWPTCTNGCSINVLISKRASAAGYMTTFPGLR
jgi:hypothetical protein